MRLISLAFLLLTACGSASDGAGSSSPATATATDTATATSTATATVTTTATSTATATATPVATIISAIAAVQLGKPITAQTPEVQTLLSAAYTEAHPVTADTDGCRNIKPPGQAGTDYRNTGLTATPHTDGTSKLVFSVEVRNDIVVATYYVVDSKPSVVATVDCTKL